MENNFENFNNYKERINREYIEDYIKNVMGKRLNANISCIYAETNPAHVKGTDRKPSMGYNKNDKTGHKYLSSMQNVCKYF